MFVTIQFEQSLRIGDAKVLKVQKTCHNAKSIKAEADRVSWESRTMWMILANKLYEFIDELIVSFSTNTFFLPSLPSTQSQTETCSMNVTHNIKMIAEEIFVVRPNIKGNAEGFGRVNPTDQSIVQQFLRLSHDKDRSSNVYMVDFAVEIFSQYSVFAGQIGRKRHLLQYPVIRKISESTVSNAC